MTYHKTDKTSRLHIRGQALCVCLAVLIPWTSLAAEPRESNSEQEVRNLAQKFVAAFQITPETTLDQVDSMLAPDSIQVTSLGTVARGKDEHRKVYQDGLLEIDKRFTSFHSSFDIERVTVSDRIAIAFGKIVMTGILRDGNRSVQREIWETLAFEKREGAWRLILEHSTLAKPQTQASPNKTDADEGK